MSTRNDFEDRFAIRELIDRYSDAVNQRDWAAFSNCFTEDAVWDVGAPFNFKLESRALISKIASEKISEEVYVVQTAEAVTIQVQGDGATARSTIREAVRSPGDKGIQMVGTYYDQIVRTGDGWRFKYRKYRVTYADLTPPVGEVFRVFGAED